MPSRRRPPPVGDLRGPFWALEFYANAQSLNELSPDVVRRRSVVTNEALVVNLLSTVSGEVSRIRAAGGSEQTLRDLQRILGDFDLSVYKSSLTVKLIGVSAQFELTLTPPYNDALEILDARIIQRAMYVVVEWGYIGDDGKDIVSSGKYAFTANRPSLTFSGTDITITLAGHDILSHTLSRAARKVKHDRRNGDVAILAKLAKEIGYTLNTEGVKLANHTGPAPDLFRTDKDPPEIEQNESDWAFFKRLAEKNGCGLIVGPGETNGNRPPKPTVFIYDKSAAARVLNCEYTLRAYQQLEGEFDVPLLSFESQPNPGIYTSVLSQSIDARKPNLAKGKVEQDKKDMAEDSRNTTARGSRTGAGSQKDAKKVVTTGGTFKAAIETPAKGAYTMSGPARDPDFMRKVREVAFDQSVFANIKADATMPGVVGLSPEHNVNVQGLGASMSGVYRVISVEHRLDGSGYETSAELIRNTLTKEQIDEAKTARGPKFDEAQESEYNKVEPPRKLEGSN